MTTRHLIGLLFVLVLSGCAGMPRAVETGRATIDGAYSIEPQVAWTAVGSGEDELWTIDGPLLENVRFVTAVPGKPILPVFGAANKPMPVYRAGMNPIEIREALENALIVLGLEQITTTEFRPAPFGTLAGYRWEYTAVNKDGLEKKGLVLTTEKAGRLQMILYSGTRIYYFDRHKDEVERLMQSIVVL